MYHPQFKTLAKEKNQTSGRFIFEPLEQGFGHTLGNALRRTLLTSIKGWAIVAVKINGAKHQFSTLEGLKEDIVELILNLKQVVVNSSSDEPLTLKLSVKGAKKVTAKDIKTPANVKIINPELVLANLADKNSKLECELIFQSGYGFTLAEEAAIRTVGVIPVDASFGPITQVNFTIETTRVGRRSDFDRLVMEIKTNGSVDPEKALMQAAALLAAYFKQIYSPVFEKKVAEDKPMIEENSELLNLTVEELDLPTRIANALRKGGYPTVRDLVSAKYDAVSKVKNLGGKSLSIIKEKLAQKGIEIFKIK